MSAGPTRSANPARPVRCTAGCRTLVWLKGALPCAVDTEFVCASCTAARAGAPLPKWRCQACTWTGPDKGEALSHERDDHEGAAVCMPIDEELDSFRSLVRSGGKVSAGAHLADGSSEGVEPLPAGGPTLSGVLDDHCPHCYATDAVPLSKGLWCTNDWHHAKAGRS